MDEAARLRDDMRSREAAAALEQAVAQLRRAGRAGEAVAILRDLVTLQPTRRNVYLVQLGEALADEGQRGEAIEALEALARDLAREDEHEEAVAALEALARIDPTVRRILAFARAAVAARSPGRALPALQRAYRDDPARVEVLELLFWAFLSNGEQEKAASIRRELSGRYRDAIASGVRDADDLRERDQIRQRINEILRFQPEYRTPALDLARDMAERNPLAIDARRTLATVRAVFRDFTGAAYEFLAAAELARAAGEPNLAREILHEGRTLTESHPLLSE